MSETSKSYLTDEERTALSNASGAELTLLLYNQLIKLAGLEKDYIAAKDDANAKNCSDQIVKLLDYFISSLDSQYDTAKDFERMYIYLKGRVIQAESMLSGVDSFGATSILNEVIRHITSIRDTWSKVIAASA
ncbi:MAG: flagellar protein FliS [Lachnospiraceae bacterium]|nr:flagellar protein FliS [Lachnospiraceae bacterium]